VEPNELVETLKIMRKEVQSYRYEKYKMMREHN
jgi:hypothetical protein